MDIQDVSSFGKYYDFIQQCRANALNAARRKGEIPRDHLPASLQVQIHTRQCQNQKNVDATAGYKMITTQVPFAYLPCTMSVASLRSIFISQMKLETHHRGSKVVVRTITPPLRMNAVIAVVEDERGTATLLSVYQQPDETLVPSTEILREGHCYLVKEPYFKASASGASYSIRVDHPSDIIQLQDGHDLIPAKWRNSKVIAGTSEIIRVQGNTAVGKKNWAEAERLYTTAIDVAKSDQDKQLAYLNRSLVNLQLGRPAKSLSDAILGGGNDTNTPAEKSLFRQASALYQLHHFDKCLEKLEILAATFPFGRSNLETKAMTGRVKDRFHEQQTGEYNFGQMYRQAKATPPLIDCATYSAAVEVRESPGRGRGLFTTRKVTAGELLICEKAFGYCYASQGEPSNINFLINLDNNTAVIGGQATLLTQLVQKSYHDQEALQALRELHHGDYKSVHVTEVDDTPVTDSFLIGRVLSLNVFGCPRTSRETVRVRTDLVPKNEQEEDTAFTTCGLWYTMSHINHACLSNCRRAFIGDMQIVRATRDMDAGTELFFWYQTLRVSQTYSETQKSFQSWGFTCACDICLQRKFTSNKIATTRKILLQDIRRSLSSTPATINVPYVARKVQGLAETYPVAYTKPGAVRLELYESYFSIGIALLCKSRHAESAEMTLKGFEALGFIINACPRGSVKVTAQEEKLEIVQWGIATDNSVNAFLHLAEAYGKIAPGLVPVARRYAELTYTMVVGEKETFLDTYPECK